MTFKKANTRARQLSKSKENCYIITELGGRYEVWPHWEFYEMGFRESEVLMAYEYGERIC
jgi:hypothetical protein